MTQPESNLFVKLFIDPVLSFFGVWRLFHKFLKASQKINFNHDERTILETQIQEDTHRLLIERIKNFNSNDVSHNIATQIRKDLNRSLLRLSQKPDNQDIKKTIDKLLKEYLSEIDQDAVQADAAASYMNGKVLKLVSLDENPVINAKVGKLLEGLVDAQNILVLDEGTENKIQENLNKSTVTAIKKAA